MKSYVDNIYDELEHKGFIMVGGIPMFKDTHDAYYEMIDIEIDHDERL